MVRRRSLPARCHRRRSHRAREWRLEKPGSAATIKLKAPWYDDERIWGSSDFAIDVYEIIDEGEDHDIDESEDNLKRYRITRAELEAGLKLMAEDYAHHFGDFLDESGDAITADVFLQLVTLKDVVYG